MGRFSHQHIMFSHFFLLVFLYPWEAEGSECKLLIGSTPTKLKSSQPHLAILPVWGPSWEIRFDIKFHSISADKWYNVFRFAGIDGSCCQIGQRIPALWTMKGTTDRLHLVTNIDSDGNCCHEFINEMGTFDCNKWYHFVVSQRKEGDDYLFEVKINGVGKVHKKNYNPKQFKNVKVFMSGYTNPANAELRFFYACQLKDTRLGPTCSGSGEIKVENNNLIGIIPSWGPTFKISFELKVLSFTTCNPMDMANYLSFTATDNNCCDIGDRIPAFFTNSGGFLQLAMQINDNGNLVKSSPKLEQIIWYNLEVEQFVENNKTFFLLRANGREVFRELQEKPKHYKNVKVYASKYLPPNAIIRNLAFEN